MGSNPTTPANLYFSRGTRYGEIFMFSTFFKSFYLAIFSIIFLLSVLFIPILYNLKISINEDSNEHESSIKISSNIFIWPVPGYNKISSYFGKRISPTQGASSYHSGIDIPATEGTKLYSIESGVIIFAGWSGGGGYCIVLRLEKYPNITASYCHVSPNIFVHVEEHINKNTIIAYVGPKNIYNIENNPYMDNNRTTNQWSHYRKPLTFNNKRKW